MLFSSYTLGRSALALALLALLPIAGAWGYEYAGYLPCDLCYEQRYAYYVGVPLALLIAAGAAVKAPRILLLAGIAVFGLAFLYNTGLAIYHSGVEAKLWEGPTACTGAMAASTGGDDLLQQLQTIKVIRCDEVGLRVLGLSLANWNIIASLGLALLAAATILRKGVREPVGSPHVVRAS